MIIFKDTNSSYELYIMEDYDSEYCTKISIHKADYTSGSYLRSQKLTPPSISVDRPPTIDPKTDPIRMIIDGVFKATVLR